MTRRLSGVLILAAVSSAQAKPEGLTSAQLMRERQTVLASRLELNVSCGLVVDARTDIVAFPAGRSDRLYTYSYGIGRAYVVRGRRAELVWCGKALYTPEDARRWGSKLQGNAARALSFPFGNKWGQLPVERGGMDVFSSFAGTLKVQRLTAGGKTLCAVYRGDPTAGESRSAFQLDAHDLCP